MRQRLRLPAVLVAALVVAEVAVVVMRPRDGAPDPLPVQARAYFSPAQLAKAEEYRTGQLWLYGVRVVVELGLLVVVAGILARRSPLVGGNVARRSPLAGGNVARRSPLAATRGRNLLPPRRHPVLAGAMAGAALSLALGTVTLPVRAISRERAVDVGLVTQGWGGWAGDVVRSEAIGAVLAGAGGGLLVVGLRRFGRRWWLPGAAVVVAFAVLQTYAAPIVLDPLFNRFTPLPAGELRRDVLALAERAGVEVGEVYVMDASRRTTAANAYVAGLGSTKRVVLYDTLLRDFRPAEVRSVVAHELAHVRYRDVPNGLLWVTIVAPFGMLAAARLAERISPRGSERGPAALPAVALSLTVVVTAATMISNQLSRQVEARADWYSLRLTGEPAALAGLQRRLAVQNVSDPDPPRLTHVLLGTHPTTLHRLGLAERFSLRAADSAVAAPREGS